MFMKLEFYVGECKDLTFKNIMNINYIEEIDDYTRYVIFKNRKMYLTKQSYDNLINYLTYNKLLHLPNNCIK